MDCLLRHSGMDQNKDKCLGVHKSLSLGARGLGESVFWKIMHDDPTQSLLQYLLLWKTAKRSLTP